MIFGQPGEPLPLKTIENGIVIAAIPPGYRPILFVDPVRIDIEALCQEESTGPDDPLDGALIIAVHTRLGRSVSDAIAIFDENQIRDVLEVLGVKK